MRKTALGLVLALGAAPAFAQTATPASPLTPDPVASGSTSSEAADDEGPDIVVTGSRRQPGAVVGDIPPELQLSPADIRSYGVSSVADLLTELAPQTGSGRGSGGAPVVLLNGRRIASFTEIRDLPTEAIQRVDILPEEVALKYGYRADQRVVNFVLRRRFRATTVELAERLATEGGRNTPQGALDLLSIQGTGRFNLHVDYQQSSALTEDERGVTGQSSPFAIGGNVVGVNGGVIDPRLSVAAGSGVTIAGVPAGTTSPTFADFVGTAGRANATDVGQYRTLLAETQSMSTNLVYARNVFGNIGATFNARGEVTSSRGLQGLATGALTLPAGNPYNPFASTVIVDRAFDSIQPLQQRTSGLTGHLGTSFNGTLGKWQWSLNGNYDRVESETFTDTGIDLTGLQARLNANDPTASPFAPLRASETVGLPANRAFSTTSTGAVDALVNGSLFVLPAGDASTSIRLGASTSRFDSRSYRAGLTQTGNVSRDIVNGQVNLDLPVSDRSKGVLPLLGDLSVNGNVAVDQYSDFGTLTTIGYGANWEPLSGFRLIVSTTHSEDAPSAQQLGNPIVTNLNVRVFDYVQGTTANVSTISGGNPNLIANNQRVTKLGATFKPLKDKDLTITANFVTATVRDPIAAFPTATAAIEAAFPDRFTRDASGILQRIDVRPINYDRTDRSELRTGINFSMPLKSKIQRDLEAFRAGTGPNPFAGLRPPGGGEGPGGGPGRRGDGAGAGPGGPGGPAGGRGPGGGGFGGGGRGGPGGGRLQFALYHTYHFTDTVTVLSGGQKLDLLNGDAIGSNGGQARHELEAQAGYFNNGLGARLSANYQSGTTVNGGTATAPETLNFGDLATANLRLFADFGGRIDLVRKAPWLRGMRVTASVDNLFNTRQRVTDSTGTVPVSYQPAYLDALGRTVRISVRKLFF